MEETSSSTPELSAAPAPWITILCSFATVAVVALTYHGLERTGGKQWKAHLVYWCVAISVIVGLPYTTIDRYLFTSLTTTLIGTVFPIYESIRAVCTPVRDFSFLFFWSDIILL